MAIPTAAWSPTDRIIQRKEKAGNMADVLPPSHTPPVNAASRSGPT